MRVFLLLALIPLMGGCAAISSRGGVGEDAPATPPPAPRVVQVETEPLVADELVGLVAIRNYTWVTEPNPSISFVLENLTATQTFQLELSSEYYDEAGEVRLSTPWSRFELLPGKRHHYFSQSARSGVVQGRAFLRKVLDEDESTP